MQVKKRDGRLEGFDREKLKRGLVAAGVEDEKVAELVDQLEDWAQEAAVDETIESQAIWEKVVEVLEGADPDAVDRYKAYRGQ